jgi:hypothetical protein
VRSETIPGFVLALIAMMGCDDSAPSPPRCGDGIAAQEELCDGEDLRGESCASQGFTSGTLRCTAGCESFDTSQCFICGNGIAEQGEVCDGTDFGSDSCAERGFASGSLRCSPTCDAVDATLCSRCGDGIRDPAEQCDGADLGADTCASRGFTDGELACDATTCRFDTASCVGPRQRDCCVENPGVPGCIDDRIADCVCATDARCCDEQWDALCSGLVEALGCGTCIPECGNGRAQPGEVCDGNDTRGQTCRTLGFQGGGLRCAASCDAFDTSCPCGARA